MNKLLKYIGIGLLLLSGSIILAHAMIPHHHHYGTVKQECENANHKTSSQNHHCDFLNELSVVKTEKQEANIQPEVVKLIIAAVLFNSRDRGIYKTEYYISSAPVQENKILLSQSPSRGSPFISLV